MSSINQREGAFVQVPRELGNLFPGNPALNRMIYNFFLTLANRLDNSSATLSEVEQRSGIPVLGRVQHLEKELAELKKMIRPKANLSEINKKIEEAEQSYRSRV